MEGNSSRDFQSEFTSQSIIGIASPHGPSHTCAHTLRRSSGRNQPGSLYPLALAGKEGCWETSAHRRLTETPMGPAGCLLNMKQLLVKGQKSDCALGLRGNCLDFFFPPHPNKHSLLKQINANARHICGS